MLCWGRCGVWLRRWRASRKQKGDIAMADNLFVAVLLIAGVIFACNAWYLQGKIDGLREAQRILDEERKEQE